MMIRNCVIGYILLHLLLLPATLCTAAPILKLHGDLLTLQVRSTPLVTILQELSDHGVRVRIDPVINPDITASFTDRPIDKALSSILKPYNYTLMWDQPDSSAPERLRLTEIQVFRQGQKNRVQPLRRSFSLPVVAGKDGTHFVKNTILARLDRVITAEKLAQLLARFDASLVDYNEKLGIVRLRFGDGVDIQEIAEEITLIRGIQVAEPDYAYPLKGGQPTDFAASQPPVQDNPPLTSNGAAIAVLDSGLAPDYTDSSFISGSFDAVSPDTVVSDGIGHGTQMSLIAGGIVNPIGASNDNQDSSSVVAVRVFDENGFTSTSTLMRSIDYAIDNGARVISMSWGTETKSVLLESAVQYAHDRGVILVAAAGNSATGIPVYPAAYENVIGVGALMPNGNIWKDSNYGEFVSLYAPGLADLPVGYNEEPGLYAGTSIATAYTAREIAALLGEKPAADSATLVEMLISDKTNAITQ